MVPTLWTVISSQDLYFRHSFLLRSLRKQSAPLLDHVSERREVCRFLGVLISNSSIRKLRYFVPTVDPLSAVTSRVEAKCN